MLMALDADLGRWTLLRFLSSLWILSYPALEEAIELTVSFLLKIQESCLTLSFWAQFQWLLFTGERGRSEKPTFTLLDN